MEPGTIWGLTMNIGLPCLPRFFGLKVFLVGAIALSALFSPGKLSADDAVTVGPERAVRRQSPIRFAKPRVSAHIPSVQFRLEDEEPAASPAPRNDRPAETPSPAPTALETTPAPTAPTATRVAETPVSPVAETPPSEFRQSFVNEPGFQNDRSARADSPFDRQRPTLRELLREDFVNPEPGAFDSDMSQVVDYRAAKKNRDKLEFGSLLDADVSFDTPECVEWDPKAKTEAPAPHLVGLRPSMQVIHPSGSFVPPPPQGSYVPPPQGFPPGSFVPPPQVAYGPNGPQQALQHPVAQSGPAINTPQTVFPAVKTASAVMVQPQDIQLPQGPRIDLKPSHGKHLPHTEVNGVVVVQANFQLVEIRAILDEIRQLQHDLNVYMGIPAPKEKIELCLFKDEKTYLKFLTEVFPSAPRDRRALYVKMENRPATLLVQRTEHFDIDLRHEMTHAIVHATIPNIPIWLDEGLAKYFEMPSYERATGNPYFNQILWNIRIGNVPAMDKLEKLRDIGDMRDIEYRDSWAWTHFMIHNSPQTHKMLAGYLQLLAKRSEEASPEQGIPLLSRYMNESVTQPKEAYKNHFRRMYASSKKKK